MRRIAAILCLCAFAYSQLFAWSTKGHEVVAALAESRLNPVARANLNLLLGNNSLASISTWPDAIRDTQPETFGWHFVDIPRNAAGFSDERDCYRPHDKGPNVLTDHQNCAVDRIDVFSKVLANGDAPELVRLKALMFIVHFIGDIHQPLHAIEDARGGNDIKVHVFGSDQCGNYACNLHGAWDFSMIDHTGYSQEEYVRRLNTLIREKHWDQRPLGTPTDWANESHREALEIWLPNGASVDEAYYQAHIGLVDERLALAGLRLAAVLNATLGSIPTPQFEEQLRKHPRYK